MKYLSSGYGYGSAGHTCGNGSGDSCGFDGDGFGLGHDCYLMPARYALKTSPETQYIWPLPTQRLLCNPNVACPETTIISTLARESLRAPCL